MLTTMRSSWSAVASSTRSFQSPPETLKTGAPSTALVHGGAVGVGSRLVGASGSASDSKIVVSLVVGRHQLYALRWSGGGTVPPLYSTGMPPSG